MGRVQPDGRSALGWVVVLLAGVEAGWMVADGARALVIGDYRTPARGRHAGQLGPWAGLVQLVGIPPRSTLMKVHLRGLRAGLVSGHGPVRAEPAVGAQGDGGGRRRVAVVPGPRHR
jgi:hypothetical protein